MFDDILERACTLTEGQWVLPCDRPDVPASERILLLEVLQFTALLIEHSFTRHLYNSTEHLNTLLISSDLNVVLAVSHLLYIFRFAAAAA